MILYAYPLSVLASEDKYLKVLIKVYISSLENINVDYIKKCLPSSHQDNSCLFLSDIQDVNKEIMVGQDQIKKLFETDEVSNRLIGDSIFLSDLKTTSAFEEKKNQCLDDAEKCLEFINNIYLRIKNNLESIMIAHRLISISNTLYGDEFKTINIPVTLWELEESDLGNENFIYGDYLLSHYIGGIELEALKNFKRNIFELNSNKITPLDKMNLLQDIYANYQSLIDQNIFPLLGVFEDLMSLKCS